MCLLSGTDWVFNENGLRFVFKWLILRFMCRQFIREVHTGTYGSVRGDTNTTFPAQIGKLDRQCMYNCIPRGVRVTTVAVGKQ
jgi:hypothetical protein